MLSVSIVLCDKRIHIGKHKYCTECDKHFDINLIKQKKLKFNRKEKKDKIPEDFEEKFKTINLKLNTSDKAILRLFLKHHRPLTQGFIADHTAVSRSTASRRLRDPLIKLGIVREIPTYNFATSSLKHYELVKNLAINAKIQD